MSEHLTQQLTLDELIYSAEGFPANHSAQLDAEREQKTNATCGLKCLESFGRFPRSTWWAKTFADYLVGQGDWYSQKSALTWKLKATKSHRIYFQLVVKTHPTEEIESGLLQTPRSVMVDETPEAFQARKKKNGYVNGTKYPNQLSQVKYGMLPTPIAGEWRDTGEGVKSLNAKQMNLTRTIAKDNPNWTGKTSQLNPLFVEEMMGFPENWTLLPFQSGEEKV